MCNQQCSDPKYDHIDSGHCGKCIYDVDDKERKCINCIYWKMISGVGDEDDDGLCRRYPPTWRVDLGNEKITSTIHRGELEYGCEHAHTVEKGWCGEFLKK